MKLMTTQNDLETHESEMLKINEITLSSLPSLVHLSKVGYSLPAFDTSVQYKLMNRRNFGTRT